MANPQPIAPDDYLRGVLARHNVPRGTNSPVLRAANEVAALLEEWMEGYKVSCILSGSQAKGTAVRGGSDCDIFFSLTSTTPYTMRDIFESLVDYLPAVGLEPTAQNVSVAVIYNDIHIDLVPGKRQSQFGNDHSLFNRRQNSRMKTNIIQQVQHVAGSGRAEEIRALKIWRNNNNLDFPSYYLELAVIKALRGQLRGDLANNVMAALHYLADDFVDARFVDVANTANIVSDDLFKYEKQLIADRAAVAIRRKYWEEIIK